ncbi:MAG: hypothetical protein WBM43_07750 [Flavobacteriaceae bacterium]
MKHSRGLVTGILLFSIVIFIMACGERKKEKHKSDDADVNTAVDTGEDSAVYIEADSWRSWSPPKSLSEYSLVRFVTDPFKLNGLYSASARYEKGDKWLTVQIIDGSSDQGKREIREHLEIVDMERNYSSEYGYEKTLVRNGIKAKEDYLSSPANQYLIKFIVDDHYGISVKSNAESAEDIWAMIDELDLGQIEGS